MQRSDYKIQIKDPEGALKVILTEFLWLTCTQELNVIGSLDFALDLEDPALVYFEHKGIIELWRKNEGMGMSWRCEFRGLFLGIQIMTIPGSMRQVNIIHCLSSLWLLSTRIIAYDDDLEGLSLWTGYAPALVARLVVRYNCSTLALPMWGRYKSGNIPELTVEADKGEVGSYTFAASYEPVLDWVQYMAEVEDEVFDLVYNDPGGWIFSYWNHDDPYGDDLTDTVKFSLSLDNMEAPEYSYDRRKEKTVCIAFGPTLTGGGHDTWLIYGPDYSGVNDIETRLEIDNGVAANLYPRGKAYLNLMRARKKLRFQVLQQAGCYYGIHYDLGDRVGGRYEGEEIVLRINSVSFTLGGMGAALVKELRLGEVLSPRRSSFAELPGPEPVEGQERIEIRCQQLS